MKIFQFGELISGLKIHGEPAPYPVLNERDARASAGLMLVSAIFAAVNAMILRELIYLQILVFIFAIEFAIRVLVNPKFAPFYAMGTLIVKNQLPEYVGAAQKRFAWAMGLGMAILMIIAFFVLGMRGAVPFTICGICILLLWCESSFGICIGCKMYKWLIDKKIISKPEVMPACPGGVCSIKKPK